MPITVSSPVLRLFQGKSARAVQASRPTNSTHVPQPQKNVDSFQPLFAGRTNLKAIKKKIENETSNRNLTLKDVQKTLTDLGFCKKDNYHYEYGNGSVKADLKHLKQHPTSPRAGQSSPITSPLVLSHKAEQAKILITLVES
jgi:hypothetical protein